MKAFVKACVALTALAAAGGAQAASTASPWAGTPETRARLLASETGVGVAGSIELGLEIELAPGWKTYWRTPGEAGAPPNFDWSGSENIADVAVGWPVPRSFVAFDFRSYGYTDHVVLPIEVRLASPGKPITPRLTLDYQVCHDICVPIHAQLALTLPAGAAASSPHSAEIARFRRQVPRANGVDGITIAPPRLLADAAGRALLVTVSVPSPPGSPELIVEGDPDLALGWPEPVAADAPGEARFRVAVGPRTTDAALLGRTLILTYIDAEEAREARLAVGH